MFNDDLSLDSLTLPDTFNTSGVTDMNRMFQGMSSLMTLTLPNSFVIKSGTDTSNIFRGITSIATLYAIDSTANFALAWRIGELNVG